MEWFSTTSTTAAEPSGVVALPESVTGPGLTLELHIAVGPADRTVAYWMPEDGVFVAEVEPGLA